MFSIDIGLLKAEMELRKREKDSIDDPTESEMKAGELHSYSSERSGTI